MYAAKKILKYKLKYLKLINTKLFLQQ